MLLIDPEGQYTMIANTSESLSDVYFAVVAPVYSHSMSNESIADIQTLQSVNYRYGSYVYGDFIYTNIRVDSSAELLLNVSGIFDLLNLTAVNDIELSILETFLGSNITTFLGANITNLSSNITSFNISNLQNFTVVTPSEVTIMHNSSGDHAVAFYNGDVVSR